MEQLREDFSAGRLAMRAAFIELSDWARLHGFDADEMTRLHVEFFDGNVKLRRAFATSLLLASVRGWQ